MALTCKSVPIVKLPIVKARTTWSLRLPMTVMGRMIVQMKDGKGNRSQAVVDDRDPPRSAALQISVFYAVTVLIAFNRQMLVSVR